MYGGGEGSLFRGWCCVADGEVFASLVPVKSCVDTYIRDGNQQKVTDHAGLEIIEPASPATCYLAYAPEIGCSPVMYCRDNQASLPISSTQERRRKDDDRGLDSAVGGMVEKKWH